jgi:hypothetical protein
MSEQQTTQQELDLIRKRPPTDFIREIGDYAMDQFGGHTLTIVLYETISPHRVDRESFHHTYRPRFEKNHPEGGRRRMITLIPNIREDYNRNYKTSDARDILRRVQSYMEEIHEKALERKNAEFKGPSDDNGGIFRLQLIDHPFITNHPPSSQA